FWVLHSEDGSDDSDGSAGDSGEEPEDDDDEPVEGDVSDYQSTQGELSADEGDADEDVMMEGDADEDVTEESTDEDVVMEEDVEMEDIGDGSQSSDASQTENQALQITKLPKSFRMSAPMVNEVSHTRRFSRLRERRLRKDKDVKDALKLISKPENSLTTALSFEQIEAAHAARSEVRDTLQAFESSNSRLKQQRTQRLRTDRTWAKLCASERRHVRRHAFSDHQASTSTTPTVSPVDGWCTQCNCHHIPNEPESKTFKHMDQCFHSRPELRPVHLIGEAGTGVGSPIGGYQRRGGGKMREQHRQYCTVGMTNEYRTSKTCIYCFCPIRQAHARRMINGKVKVVRLHDAVECINPDCPSVGEGFAIKPRDAHAAVAIAIAGASTLL
ncbi:MAG: hypothetical protein J3Q66DRAFT_424384, partial [Benniella sp.]